VCVCKITSLDDSRPGILRVDATDKFGTRLTLTYFTGPNANYRTGLSAQFRDASAPRSPAYRVVCGKLRRDSRDNFSIMNPDVVAPVSELSKILTCEPIYPLTRGLSKKRLRDAILAALETADAVLSATPDSLPPKLLSALSWPTLREALHTAHHPSTPADILPSSPARMRLAFEELATRQISAH
jgi:RecG-like helicase